MTLTEPVGKLSRVEDRVAPRPEGSSPSDALGVNVRGEDFAIQQRRR
jgi:hypothetical protein